MKKQKASDQPRRKSPNKRLTVLDIAKAADASQTAVSYVINNRPGVGPELRQRILAIMKKLNYTPSPAARQLSMRKSDMLGIAIQDLTPGWFLSVFHGMLIKAAMCNRHVITGVSLRPGDELALPQSMISKTSVDGLLWLDPRITPDTIRKFKETHIPFVVVQNDAADPDVNTISTENRLGAKEAVRHLLTLGYRRILLLTGHPENVSSQEKLEGARGAFRDFKLSIPNNRILNGQYNALVAAQEFEAYLKKGQPRPDAIFAFNDEMALGLLRWMKPQGIRVPEDIALVGYDGTEEARQADLTTVETPTRELGVMATQLLIEVIEDPSRPAQHITLHGHLCIRGTCGARLRQPAAPTTVPSAK